MPIINKEFVNLFEKFITTHQSIRSLKETSRFKKDEVKKENINRYVNTILEVYGDRLCNEDKSKIECMKTVEKSKDYIFHIEIGNKNVFKISVFVVRLVNDMYEIIQCTYTKEVELTTFSSFMNWLCGIDEKKCLAFISQMKTPFTCQCIKDYLIYGLIKEINNFGENVQIEWQADQNN